MTHLSLALKSGGNLVRELPPIVDLNYLINTAF